MKKAICTILKISEPTFYVWKNKKHTILIKFLEKVLDENYFEISEIIKENQVLNISSITMSKKDLCLILEISEKNVYRWLKKRPLLFIILERVFNNYLNSSVEEFLNNGIERDFTLTEEEETFAKMFDLDFFRSIFKNVVDYKYKQNKLITFKKEELEKLSIACKVLFELFDKNTPNNKKNIIRLFLEKDKFDAFALNQILEISEIIASSSQDNLWTFANDIFEFEDIQNIIKYNIKRMSYIDISLLIYTFVFSRYLQQHKQNISIESEYLTFLNKIYQSNEPLFTNKVKEVFKNF